MNKKDQYILKKIRAGDKSGFRVLFDQYYKRLYLYATSYLEDQFVAEDIVQDIFISMWENRKNLKINTSISSYLFSAIHNRCIHYLRKMKVRNIHRQNEILKLKEAEILSGNSNDFFFSEIESDEIRQIIIHVFDSLPEKTQNIFRLSRTGLLTYAEIAKHLDISIKTVEYHISKALKEFRLALQPYIG
jgi:RNA polymerase sigma-70 factor (ECF subfamily)